ncbi:MAG: hypothetical protein ACLQAT_15685 [Candidatus Binataceae bacterium]
MLDPQFRRAGQKVGDRTPPPGKATARLKCWIDLANLLKDFNPVAAAQAAGREIRILEAVRWVELPDGTLLPQDSPVTPFLLRELERRFRAPRDQDRPLKKLFVSDFAWRPRSGLEIYEVYKPVRRALRIIAGANAGLTGDGIQTPSLPAPDIKIALVGEQDRIEFLKSPYDEFLDTLHGCELHRIRECRICWGIYYARYWDRTEQTRSPNKSLKEEPSRKRPKKQLTCSTRCAETLKKRRKRERQPTRQRARLEDPGSQIDALLEREALATRATALAKALDF